MIDQWDLPSEWKWVTLSDVAQINPRKPRDLEWVNEEPTTFVPMAAVDDNYGRISEHIVRPFGEVKRGYTYFQEKDVLFAKITPCMENGKMCIAKELLNGFGFGTTEFHVIRTSDNILPDYVYRYVRQPWVRSLAETFFTGAVGQQRVPKEFLVELPIPFPSLDEQKRIVAIIDEQMQEVEQAHQAIQAELEAAEALAGAYLREVFESDEAQEWEVKPLLKLLESKGQYGTSSKSSHEPIGVPNLGMGNIKDGNIVWNNLKYIDLNEDEFNKFVLNQGDILFNRTNSAELVGKTAVYDDTRDAVFASYLVRFATNRKFAEPHFVASYINSPLGQQFIDKQKTQSIGQANVSASKMHTMPVPCPPIDVQEKIVEDINTLSIEIEELREALLTKLEAIEAMPAAILRRAFSGGY